MKHLILLAGFLVTLATNAQTISRSVIPCQGGNYTGSNLQVSYTVGEPCTQTLSAANLMLTQGFQQPDTFVSINLNITCFIQGYYLWNGEMQPALFNQGMSNDLSITDTLGVQIIDAAPPYNVVQNLQAILHTDGTLHCKLYPSLLGHAYYIALQHRNAVETWSANPVMLTGNTAYNFSNSAAQAFGDNQKDVSGNGTLFALYSGDNVKDSNVDLYDLNGIESDIVNFAYGYYNTDINGDGNVDLFDLLAPEENVINFVYAVHP